MKQTLTGRYCLHQMAYWASAAGVISFASAFLLEKGFAPSQVGILLASGNFLSCGLQPLLADVTLGKPDTFTHQLRPILQNADIFGVDLYEAGLAKTVEDDFRAMLAGPGAVRDILCRQLSERVRSDQP